MLALDTTAAWSSGTVTVTVNGHSDIYTVPAVLNVVDAMNGLSQWANNVSRSWHGTDPRIFSWSWTRDTGNAAAKVVLKANGTFSVQGNSAANSTIGFSTSNLGAGGSGTQYSLAGQYGAAGTWAPGQGWLSVVGWLPHLEGKGDAAANGAVRPGCPGTAHWLPTVRAAGRSLDRARLAVVLANATSPRACYVGQRSFAGSYYRFSLGKVTTNRTAPSLFTFDLECVGAG